MPRNRAKRDAKNSRSAERGCSSVLPAAEQAANGWSPRPCLTPSRLCRAIAQSAMQKTAGAMSAAPAGAFRSATAAGGTWRGDRMFLCPPRRRTGGEWLEPATLPYPQQAMPRNRAAMHKQLSSPKRSPPPHTPLEHPAMYLLCIHIPQNSCTIFVILLCRGRLIAANSIYLINIVRLPHVGWAATKIPSRLQIKNKPNVK